jgi:hypothetical protein
MSLLELQPSTITGKQLLANDFKASHDERFLPLFFCVRLCDANPEKSLSKGLVPHLHCFNTIED